MSRYPQNICLDPTLASANVEASRNSQDTDQVQVVLFLSAKPLIRSFHIQANMSKTVISPAAMMFLSSSDHDLIISESSASQMSLQPTSPMTTHRKSSSGRQKGPRKPRQHISGASLDEVAKLEQFARRQFIAFLDKQRTTWPIKEAFPDLNPSH
ncbi:uncharacterized protein BO97DRAFT_271258 [Aspergillus homomorphus CBS 101889]|uniref:Uncharacterized protein n=1 Tax=Aspergillus homomorphus (strain CBS 101889) TaxID=1450537 RepID=A0A395I5M8_ASPHC|nr:hypothetical protein BO97DRAFT_271258 [Aspergillus homomorphus CBS 101889]RAL14498.1 hypothetical protein BO97DRAFT_271258 [Aspergillus homomorphus CBS 101889]